MFFANRSNRVIFFFTPLLSNSSFSSPNECNLFPYTKNPLWLLVAVINKREKRGIKKGKNQSPWRKKPLCYPICFNYRMHLNQSIPLPSSRGYTKKANTTHNNICKGIYMSYIYIDCTHPRACQAFVTPRLPPQ
ncbi:hypothetical protein LI328DRAFT_30823 [Trichoderma asperelloides]|nr:hypothetical protein LI328DRAFT_30823 [Trichoderma asperelloides]